MNETGLLQPIYEDNHLLIVSKPGGMLVQGDATGDTPLVEVCKNYIKEKYNKPGAVFLGVVHRIDRPVSGVVVFARTSKALERMNKLFRDKQARKTYWAVVGHQPKPAEDTLVHWLVKDEKRNKTTTHRSDPGNGKRSELHYRTLKKSGAYFLLEVRPLTGRSHQIRAQLAAIHCPVVGDLKYGYPHPHENASICLHARELEFIHPVLKTELKLTAGVPASEVWNAFE